jgi:hypothetical protein
MTYCAGEISAPVFVAMTVSGDTGAGSAISFCNAAFFDELR